MQAVFPNCTMENKENCPEDVHTISQDYFTMELTLRTTLSEVVKSSDTGEEKEGNTDLVHLGRRNLENCEDCSVDCRTTHWIYF